MGMHYSEIYHSGEWYFMKRDVPHASMLSCDAPLLADAPRDLLQKARAELATDRTSEWALHSQWQAWFLCTIYSTLNRALSNLRGRLCLHGFNSDHSLRVPLPGGKFYDALKDFFSGSSTD